MNYCNVTILGRLTRDPDLRQTNAGTDVCNIGLAWNRRVKRGDQWEDEPCFINGTVWGARGAALSRNFRKGDPIFVVGDLRINRWTDRENRERQDLVLHVSAWQFTAGAPRDAGVPADAGGDDPPF